MIYISLELFTNLRLQPHLTVTNELRMKLVYITVVTGKLVWKENAINHLYKFHSLHVSA